MSAAPQTRWNASMSETVIAAQTYTIHRFMQTFPGNATALAKLRAMGYEAVEVSAFGSRDRSQLTQILKDTGLTVTAVHTRWQRLVEDIDAIIKELHAWDCKHAVLSSIPYAYLTAQQIAKFAAMAEGVGRKLAEASIQFSYHVTTRALKKVADDDGNRKTLLEMLLENADPRYLKAQIDTYHIQIGGGDPAEWIRKYSDRCPMLHLKDMTVGPNGATRFAEVGEGNLNWPAILAAAKQAKVRWYCVEQDDCYDRDPFDSLKISLDNLHAMGLR